MDDALDTGTTEAQGRVALGSLPVSAAQPEGSDIRNDDDFDALQTEVRRMETEGPNSVDWKSVCQQAETIISSRSKDLLVASWLTFALFKAEGYRGLADGLGIIDGMIHTFWDTMFPPKARERGRVNAIDWLAERTSAVIEAEPPETGDDAAVAAAYDRVLSIDDALSARLVKEQAALGTLVRALRGPAKDAKARAEAAGATQAQAESVSAAPPADAQPAAGQAAPVDQSAPEAPPPAPPAPAAAAPPSPRPQAAASVTVAAPPPMSDDLSASIAQFESGLRQLADAIRAQNPADFRAYLYARVAGWGSILQPPESSGGKTLLPPLSHQQREIISGLVTGGRPEDLLEAAEGAFAMSPFWFDMQRIVATTLEALGPAYADAAAVVVNETRVFLTRLPSLTDLSFHDGAPFADGETRSWISRTVLAAGGGAGGAVDEGAAEALDAARRLATQGKLKEALSQLTEGARTAPTGREQFLWQLAQAELCVERKEIHVAFALLDHLDHLVDLHGLDDWDPAVSARVAELRLRGLQTAEARQMLGDTGVQEVALTARRRLARVDIAAATNFAP